jgi:hypothetical protein
MIEARMVAKDYNTPLKRNAFKEIHPKMFLASITFGGVYFSYERILMYIYQQFLKGV